MMGKVEPEMAGKLCKSELLLHDLNYKHFVKL